MKIKIENYRSQTLCITVNVDFFPTFFIWNYIFEFSNKQGELLRSLEEGYVSLQDILTKRKKLIDEHNKKWKKILNLNRSSFCDDIIWLLRDFTVPCRL